MAIWFSMLNRRAKALSRTAHVPRHDRSPGSPTSHAWQPAGELSHERPGAARAHASSRSDLDRLNQRPALRRDRLSPLSPFVEDQLDGIAHYLSRLVERLPLGVDLRQGIDPPMTSVFIDDVEGVGGGSGQRGRQTVRRPKQRWRFGSAGRGSQSSAALTGSAPGGYLKLNTVWIVRDLFVGFEKPMLKWWPITWRSLRPRARGP